MFLSFLDHHQVHKELKYITCYKIILVRNGIPLSLHCLIEHCKITKCGIKVMGAERNYNSETISLRQENSKKSIWAHKRKANMEN